MGSFSIIEFVDFQNNYKMQIIYNIGLYLSGIGEFEILINLHQN